MPSLETKTIGLSKYIGSDKPTYLVDHNNDMDKIDNEVAALRAADDTKLTKPSGTAAQILNGQGDAVGITDDVTLDSPISAMFFKIAHPVGDIIETTSNRNPGSYFQTNPSYADTYEDGACGTWKTYAAGRVLIGNGASDRYFSPTVNNGIGGASSYTLSNYNIANYGAYFHQSETPTPTITVPLFIERTAFDILQPYQVVYIWERIA